MPIRVECAPAFNYARSAHTTEITMDTSIPHAANPCAPGSDAPAHMKALFASPDADMDLDLRFVPESSLENVPEPDVRLALLDLAARGHRGPAVCTEFTLVEGQVVTFILRSPPRHAYPDAARPSKERAEQLGVPFESESASGRWCVCALTAGIELVMTASELRAPDDPMLTQVRPAVVHLCRLGESWFLAATHARTVRSYEHVLDIMDLAVNL